MSMEDFIYRIRNDKNAESFSLADKNVDNALALFYANMGYHRFRQPLKFCDPPPALDEVVEQVMPDFNDTLLTSKDIKQIELDFDRRHSYYPRNLPACGACGRRHNMPDDSKLEYCTVNLNERCMDLLVESQATYTWTCTADGQTRSQSRIAEANVNFKQQQITLIIYLAHLYHRQGILSILLIYTEEAVGQFKHDQRKSTIKIPSFRLPNGSSSS
jgi:hypothetical protein